MIHELWEDADGGAYFTLVLAGPCGAEARAALTDNARLTWTVEAESHFDAMTKYYEHQGWGTYTTDFPEVDRQTYTERGRE